MGPLAIIWAQAVPTVVNTGAEYAGWGGAGLLGLVLSWLLLKHLPDLDKARKEERADFLKALEEQRRELVVAMAEARKEFAVILLRQEEKFERNLDKILERMEST